MTKFHKETLDYDSLDDFWWPYETLKKNCKPLLDFNKSNIFDNTLYGVIYGYDDIDCSKNINVNIEKHENLYKLIKKWWSNEFSIYVPRKLYKIYSRNFIINTSQRTQRFTKILYNS